MELALHGGLGSFCFVWKFEGSDRKGEKEKMESSTEEVSEYDESDLPPGIIATTVVDFPKASS